MRGSALAGIALAFVVAGCGSSAASLSPAPTATVTTVVPSAAPTVEPTPTPGTADRATARVLADRFLSAFVAEKWTTAFALLAPESQKEWGPTVAKFAANWPHPARDTGGHYTITVITLADAGITGGGPDADLSRGSVFQVEFPDPAGRVPGPFMLLIAAPDFGGTWRLWRLW